MAGLRQRFRQLPAQIGIVFNNKNSHGDLSARGQDTAARRIHINGETPTVLGNPGNDVAVPRLLGIEHLTAIAGLKLTLNLIERNFPLFAVVATTIPLLRREAAAALRKRRAGNQESRKGRYENSPKHDRVSTELTVNPV